MKYKILRDVRIRREPRITSTNIRGLYTVGKIVDVFGEVSNSSGETWGQVSEPDATGVSLWICLRNINGKFAELIQESVIPVDNELLYRVAALEQRISALEHK